MRCGTRSLEPRAPSKDFSNCAKVIGWWPVLGGRCRSVLTMTRENAKMYAASGSTPLASPHAAPKRSQKRSIFCASPGMYTPLKTRRKAGTMPRPLSSKSRTKAVMTSSCCPRRSPTLAPSRAALFSRRKRAASSALQPVGRAAHQASGSALNAPVSLRTSEARLRRSAKAAAQAPWPPAAAPLAPLALLALRTPALLASRIPAITALMTLTRTSTATGRSSSRAAAQASVSRQGSATAGPPTSQSNSLKVSQTCRGVSSSQPRPPTAHWRVDLQARGQRTKPQSSAVAAGRYGNKPVRAALRRSVKRRSS
mmetsp:Transcript_75495/g.233545  ORF Transcript_75495/g.233545 Transcript_75495/m.233545 type:complete len:311 (-) Transcript_75495:160-1092(-)